MAKNATSFTKGNRGGGRPPGTTNKITRTVKETVLAAFNDLQNDPKVRITEWARNEPTEFYKIASKLIPTEVSATVKNVIRVRTIDDEIAEPDNGAFRFDPDNPETQEDDGEDLI